VDNSEAREDVVLPPRERAQTLRRTREHDADLGAPTTQVAQRAERIATVVPAAGERDDLLARDASEEEAARR
jgi:hypothetical protein